jgi:pimeloyl-ACP methyl ester carboxylesterase
MTTEEPSRSSFTPTLGRNPNGDDDRMVPTTNSYDLARRLPNATLRIYPDAGHGGIFQFHEQFVRGTLEFLGS